MKTYSHTQGWQAAIVAGFACLFLALALTTSAAYAEDSANVQRDTDAATATTTAATEAAEPTDAQSDASADMAATDESISTQSDAGVAVAAAAAAAADDSISTQSDAGVPVYRLYNTVTSEHLYTTFADEAVSLANNYTTLNWVYEGTAWQAPSTGKPVYRLYNPGLGHHMYTSDPLEIADIVTNWGWISEGVYFYSGGNVPIYQLYNPYMRGLHFWTASKGEYDWLPEHQWTQEGRVLQGIALGNPDKFNTLPGYNPQIIPTGEKGWYTTASKDKYYYMNNDGSLAKGWLITDTAPTGKLQENQRFWLDPETGVLAQQTLVQTSDQTYAYAKDNGVIVRGVYDAKQDGIYIGDNDGNLAWGTQTSWVIDDFGNGLQRYNIDPNTHAARSGFFTVDGYGKCYGTQYGYVLRGKLPFDECHVLVANNDGQLLSTEGWTTTDEFDGEEQIYRIDRCYSDEQGNDYYGAHTLLFTLGNNLYYGQPDIGYIARNHVVVADDGKPYRADGNGKLTLEKRDWMLEVAPSSNVPDWGNDPIYTEQMRARAIANGGSRQFYITVDSRIEGGGRVIIFTHVDNTWVALAGWYANVGRWNKSHTMTRSFAGIHPITDKIEEGTVANNDPWVIPYFTDYLHWIDPNGNDDGQGFHYTPNSNQQGNDMSGCTAFAQGRIEQAKWIWANVPLGSLVDICGVATPSLEAWENS